MVIYQNSSQSFQFHSRSAPGPWIYAQSLGDKHHANNLSSGLMTFFWCPIWICWFRVAGGWWNFFASANKNDTPCRVSART